MTQLLDESTTDLLRKAHALIGSRGWWQGDYYPLDADWRTAPVCPSAAVYVAAGWDPKPWMDIPVEEHWRVSDAVARVMRVLERRGYRYALTTWNDEDGRTEAEVLELLAEAAGAVHVYAHALRVEHLPGAGGQVAELVAVATADGEVHVRWVPVGGDLPPREASWPLDALVPVVRRSEVTL